MTQPVSDPDPPGFLGGFFVGLPIPLLAVVVAAFARGGAVAVALILVLLVVGASAVESLRAEWTGGVVAGAATALVFLSPLYMLARGDW